MAVLLWVTLGLLLAGIAKYVVWEEDGASWLALAPLGIAGAILGAIFRGALFVASSTPGFDLGAMLCAIAGTAFLLWVRHEIFGRTKSESADQAQADQVQSYRRAA